MAIKPVLLSVEQRDALYARFPRLRLAAYKDYPLDFPKDKVVTDGGAYYFDEKAAKNAVGFFINELRHVEGPLGGQLFELETWQQFVVEEIFGWKRVEDDLRKYREVFIFIPRKNGKTFFGAGLALYCLYATGEYGARVVSAAADTDQAGIIYNVAKQNVEENPRFADISYPLRKKLYVPPLGAEWQVVSADAHTKHGKNLSCVVVDETHAQPNRELIDVLFTSVGARAEPLKINLTTAGFDKESICYTIYDYAKRILDPNDDAADPEFLGIIFEPDEGDDWKEEATWYRANPNLGVSVRLDYVRAECKKAQLVPTYENTFKRLQLNFWTEQETRWVPVEVWDKCGSDYTYDDLAPYQCWVGLDLSSRVDLTALVVAFLLPQERVRLLSFVFMPRDNIRLRKERDKVYDYEVWEKKRHIITTDGNVVDYNAIHSKLKDLKTRFNIKTIYADPWNATHLCNQLRSDNFEVIEIDQTYNKLSGATKEFEALLLSGKLEHDKNSAMRWMFKNIQTEEDINGNVRFSKRRSKEKIDGMAATVLALVGVLGRGVTKEAKYKTRGITSIRY